MKENSDGNDTNVGSIGNSIEEEIEILEELRTHGYVMLLMKYGDRIKTNFKLAKAIENILSAYKRVLKENEQLSTEVNSLKKENEELKNKIMEKELEIIGKEEYTKASMGEIIEQYYTANEDCITKQRIEDIIDRIDYDIKKTKEIISNDQKNNYQITRLKAMNTKSLDIKKRLQELLERRNNNEII